MKRDLRTLNRTLALAIAAAMTMTSAPSAVFAADSFSDGNDAAFVTEAPAAEEPEFISEAEEAPVEEVFVDEAEEEAAVDTLDAAAYPQGTPGAPVKVTGLYLDKDGENGITEPTLRWNYVAGVYGYEFLIVDAQGNEYGNSPDGDWDETTGTYKYSADYLMTRTGSTLPQMSISNLGGAQVYKIAADGSAYELIYADAEKKTPLRTWKAGQTYTIKVRAVNRYQEAADKEAVEKPGEWSDAITYTVPAGQVPVKIDGLKKVDEDDDYIYFDFATAITAGYIIYQTDTDPSFANCDDWDYDVVYSDSYKLRLYKNSYTEGKTYYLRAANGVDGEYLKDEEGKRIWSAPISFTVAKKEEALKAIKGFKLYRTTADSFEFHFAPVLEDEDNWEMQYSKDVNFAADVSTTHSLRIYKENLEGDVNYFVRALTYKYDEKGTKVYGTPSEVVTIRRAKAPSVGKLTLAEKTQNAFVFTYTADLNSGEAGVEYWVSEDKNFANNPQITEIYSSYNESRFSLGFDNLTPGKTYYVRARAYSYEDALNDSNKAEYEYYSAFTNTVTVRPAVAKTSVSAVVASTSIKLQMNHNGDLATGYQVYKKVGKKYELLTKTTEGAYTDKGLKADTAYTYRVRAYYVDDKTKKTSYGEWTYYDATTWGGNLNLVASAKAKNAVKLTWNKISGAKGYEVYRSTTASNGDTFSVAAGSNSYTKWTLVKDIKSAKTKSYTVKGLTAGTAYSFKVRAYKTVGTKKYYIEGTDRCDLSFNLNIASVKKYTNGSVRLTWKPVYAGNGYLIEKQDNATGRWNTYKTITKASTSYITLPKAVGEEVTYRIRAFKKGTPKEYTTAYECSVSPFLAAPTGVAAKANKADGSIKVSWKAVPGADYYAVYRTTSPANWYDKDTKSYGYYYASEVPVYVAAPGSVSGYERSEEDLTATTLVDRPITYTTLGGIERTLYKGPKAGVKYYYYVVAYKNGTVYEYADRDNSYSSGASKAASATVSKTTVAKPSLKSVKSPSRGKASLVWKKVSGATGYEVYRSTRKNKGFTKIAAITKGATVKYTDKKAEKGKKYYYKIRAVKANEAGIDVYSSYSAVKAVTIKK